MRIHVELYNVLCVKVCALNEIPILFTDKIQKTQDIRQYISYEKLKKMNPSEVPEIDEKSEWT